MTLGQGVGTDSEIERHADELLNARPTTVLTPRLRSVIYNVQRFTPSTHEQCLSVKFYI